MKFADPAMTRNRVLDRTNHVVRVDALLDEAVFGAGQQCIDTAAAPERTLS